MNRSRNFFKVPSVTALKQLINQIYKAMKKFILIIISALIALPVLCQEERLQRLEKAESNTEDPIKTVSRTKKTSTVKQDTVIVEVGDEIFSVREMGDETKIKIGKKEFRVVEDNDGVVVFRSTSKDNNDRHRRNYERFRGHLGGLEFGLNGFLTDYWSTSLKPEDNYFDLYTAKSTNFNLLLPCLNIGFTRHFGLAATLGISWNTYRFDGNNTIVKDENGIIGPYYPDIRQFPILNQSLIRLLLLYLYYLKYRFL